MMDQYNNIYQTIPAVNEPDNMRFDLTQGSPWIVYLLAGKLSKIKLYLVPFHYHKLSISSF